MTDVSLGSRNNGNGTPDIICEQDAKPGGTGKRRYPHHEEEMMHDPNAVPPNLPVPLDDGACDHLPGRMLPSLVLPATSGRTVNLASLSGTVVIYCYPRTGRPGQPLPDGWNEIPGARGCTPQSCAFRDHFGELQALDAAVFGLSTQTTAYQEEAVERLHLPYELLSDVSLQFATALDLPRFEVDGMTLIKRLTLIARDGKIARHFYPVFPPDRNAEAVLGWLRGEQH